MKTIRCALLVTGLALLLPALAQTPVESSKKTAEKTAAGASSPGAFSRENTADICTTAAQTEWLPPDEMKLLAEHRGYRIKTFKLAKGNCYEVYGFDRQGRIVEAYFDPVTSKLIRQNIAK
jgi:hypothetical protein